MKIKGLAIRLDENLLNEFNQLVEKNSVNKSALIRSWIENYIKEDKEMDKMTNKIEIAEKRYEEMEDRKARFLKDYKESGNELSLELANIETENMNKLALAIMKAKK